MKNSRSILPQWKFLQGIKSPLMFFLMIMLPVAELAAQPVWSPAAPSVGTVTPISISVNFGIDRVGTVYLIVLNYNNPSAQSPATIRFQALTPTAPGLVYNAVIPVSGGEINTLLEEVAATLAPDTYHTIYLVAADASGTLMATSVRLDAVTLSCPNVVLFTYFDNLGECVNLGAQGTYQVAPLGANPTGVLAGTTFTIDWGDGSPLWTYTSSADDDLPPAQYHTYSSTTDCAYQGTWVVTNPCGEFLAGTNVFVVHGRDIPDDGDGVLQMEETTTGAVDIVYVCEGSSHDIVLRDISTWNCQNPNVPAPLDPADYDNESPRRIQFVYGETPAGAVMNTITGDVVVGGSNIANVSDGYVGSVLGPFTPPNPNTLSDVITIPATCEAGERFYVYIKNWNKCNPYVSADLNYVYDEFIIEVVEAPPAPAVTSPLIYCLDDVPSSLTVTPSLAGNTINWYDDAALTTLLYTGNTLPINITTAGNYDYYVTETSGVNGCESPSSTIDLIAREELSRPGPISGPSPVCLDATGLVYSVNADPPVMPYGGATEYYWTVPTGWTITSGQGTKEITVNAGGTAGTRTIRVVNRYITNPQCPSNSRSLNVTVNPLSVGGTVTGGSSPICLGSSTGTMTLSGYTGTIQRWEKRLLPAATWTSISNTSTTYSEVPASVGTWEYRAVVQSGVCSEAYSSANQIDVIPPSDGGTTAGGVTPICIGSGTGNITVSGYTGTITRWQRRLNGGSWTNIAGTAGMVTYSETPSSDGTWDYRAEVTNGSCPSSYSTYTTIVVNPVSVGGSVTGGNSPICLGSSTGTMTLTGYTGSVVRWMRRVNGGGWSIVSNTTSTYSEIPPFAGIWDYRAEVRSGVCSSTYSDFATIVVVSASVGGTVTGGTTPLCPGDNTGVMTLSGNNGSVVRWESRVDGGSWTEIANTNTTYSEVPASSGTWDYRAYVQNAPCPGVYSSIRTLVVRPTYDAQLHDDAGICNNTSTNFNIELSGGTSPYTVNYTRNGIAQTALTNYVSGTDVSTGVLTTGTYVYSLTSVTDANGCQAQSLGTDITILVGNPPTAATLTGSGDACDGASSWIRSEISDGAPPFTINYTLNSVPQAAVTNYNSGDNIDLGILPVGSYTYEITSIADVCGTTVPAAGMPPSYTININPYPSAAATANNIPTLCYGGTTDIVLQSTVPLSDFTWVVTNTPAVTWEAGSAPSDGSVVNGIGTSIAQTLAHSSTYPTSVVYSITPVGPGATACAGPTISRVVVVNPEAQVNQPGNQTICNGSMSAAVTFSTVNTVGTTTYSWTNNNTSIGLAASGTGNIAAFPAVNTGSAPVTATITVTPTFIYGSLTCPGPSESFTITVNPTPAVTGKSDVICSGGTFSVTPVNGGGDIVPAGTTYSWSAPVVTGGLTGGVAGSGSSISGTLTNPTNIPQTATYTVTPVAAGCTGTTFDVVVTVNPTPWVTNKSAAICSGGTFSVTPVNGGGDIVPAGTTYSWGAPAVTGGITGGASGSGSSISGTLTNPTNTIQTATYTVTPLSGVCTGSAFDVVITVNPTPSVTNKNAAICSGGTFSVTPVDGGGDIVPAGTTYSWGAPVVTGGLTGGVAGSGSIISGTLVNPTNIAQTATYTVTPVSGGCTGSSFDVVVTVNPTPTVADKNASICSGGTFTVTPVNGGGDIVPAGTTYSWGVPVVTGGLTGGASGSGSSISGTLTNPTNNAQTATYTVTPVSGGCTGSSFDVVVTVNATPSVTNKSATICSGSTFSVTPVDGGSDIVPAGTTYSWGVPVVTGGITGGVAGSGSSISGTLTNPTNTVQTATYTVTPASGGCAGTPFSVIVTVSPAPSITDKSSAICSGDTFSVTPVNGGGDIVPAGTTYSWGVPVVTGGITGGASGSGSSISGTLINPTNSVQTATYTVTPVSGACTGATFEVVVTVNTIPVLDPALNMATCSNTATGLTLQVAATSAPADSYDILGISVQSGLTADAGNAGLANGVAADYLAGDIFTNMTGVDRNVTYTVRPVLGTCIGTPVNIIVTIRPQPVIVTGQAKTVCSGIAIDKEILLLPANTPAGTTFSWGVPVMSDGSSQGTAASGVAADPAGTLHLTDIIVNTGSVPITATYTVTPVSAFSCAGNPTDVVITINPEPAAPVISGPVALCAGETDIVYSVPLNAGSTYTWTVPASVGIKTFDFNSSAIIINAATVAGSGDITVVERNSYGCDSPAGLLFVNITEPPSVAGITGNTVACALETAVYSVPDNPGSVYTWTLPAGTVITGDPSAATVTVIFGTVSGNISVREIDAGGCITNHTPLPVLVNPQPTATISNNGTICTGDSFPLNVSLTGTAPWTLTYAINGTAQPSVNIAATPYTLNASSAGNYTIVSVVDGNLCTGPGSGSATVSYYPVPSATISGSAEMCSGGSATLTISLTGSSPYNFTYTDGTTPVTVTNYPTSVYTTTVAPVVTTTYVMTVMTDNNGCDGTLAGSAIITVNPRPVATLAGTNLTCYANNSGAIDLTVTSGTAPFSYAWTGPDGYTAGTEDISGLMAGYYSVVVTDSKGCTASASITITQPALLTLSKSGDIVLLCYGDANGTGSFTASGGTTPYTFTTITNTSSATLVPGAASVSITNAAEGTITVLVTDANGCTAQSTVYVTQPNALNLTASLSLSIEGSHNINCYGSNTGSITTTVTGGTAPYIYAWTTSGGGSGLTAGAANQSSLTAGTYDLTVTDAYGCTISGSWTLTQPAALALSVTTDDNLIGTCSSAQLNSIVSGGVMPAGGYIYNWSPAAGLSATDIANPVATPSSTTTYTVTVTDANSCTISRSVTIVVAPVLTAVVYADDNLIGTCPSSEANLDVTVNGGESPYTYLWNPAAGLSSASISNPVAKPSATTTYTVTVTDANSCTVNANVTVTVAPDLAVTATVDDNLIGTCPTSVAHLTATATGGEGGYSYSWDNASTLSDAGVANPTAKPSVTTTYTVTVTDANGCTEQASVTVDVAPPLSVTAVADDQIIGTCPGSVAHLDANVTGGEPGYTYKWAPLSGLDDSNIQSPTAKPSVTTTYTVTVTDANGCTATSTITITVQPVLTLTLSVDDSSIGTCPGSDAQITSVTGGGEPAYSYSWSPAAGLSSTTVANPVAKPSTTTTYTLTVTDVNGCTIARSITITVVSDLVAAATASDPIIGTCPASTSTLNVTASGGEPAYTYSWSPATGLNNPGIQSPVAKPAATTLYTVTVTDNNGCTTTADVTVTVAPDLTAVATTDDSNIGTCATSVAHLDVTASGGEPGYIYLWSPSTGLSDPNSKTPTAKPSSTTTYTVTVTDANACTTTASVTVNVAPALTVTATADDYIIGTCPTSTAQINSVVAGGEPGYSYLWSPSTGLSDISIANPVAKPSVTTTYTVVVTDVNGCTATSSVTITVAPVLTATASASDLNIGTCPSSVSYLSASGSGGEAGYTYSWLPVDGLSDPLIMNPVAKPAVTTTYVVTVTDANNCTATASVTVTVLDDLVPAASADDMIISTCPTSRSNLDVSVTGGEPGYTYSWSPVAGLSNPTIQSPVAKPTATTTYTVTVTDANGCQATDDITITVQPVLAVAVTADDYIISSCPSSISNITATASGGEEFAGGGYTWSWAPSAGLSATDIPNPVAKPASTTTYSVTVTDANGCTATNIVTIAVRNPLAATAFASDYLIGECPSSTSTLDVTVTGGEEPYLYSWTPAATLSDPSVKSPVAKPLASTTYTVTVTDANGCTITSDVTIDIAPALTVTAAVDDDPIGECPTSVAHLSTTVTGGEGGYTYLWDNETTITSGNAFSPNPTVKPAVSTLYTVIVTDMNGCQATATVMVNVAPPLTVTASDDDDIIGECPTSVSNLDAVASGGEPLVSGDYIYSWSPSAGLNYTNVQNPVAKPASTTTYTITVTDRNGCTATDDVTITVVSMIVLTPTPVVYNGGFNVTCNGASDGAIDLSVSGGEAPFVYTWTGPSGFTASTEDISGLTAGTYQVYVSDANSCSSITTIVLSEPAVLTLGTTPDVNLSCFGDNNASGSFNISGGTSPYTFNVLSNTSGAVITTDATSASFTDGSVGEVTIGVVDANGCTTQATITITQPDQLLPGSIDGTQEVCYMGNPAALTEVTAPSGGPSTIIFQWERSTDGGVTWNAISGATTESYDPPSGITQTTDYRRAVTSGICTTEYSNIVTVTVNPLPVADISGSGSVCPGDAATVMVTITTGEAPYTVVLNDGTTVAGYTSGDPITVYPLTTTVFAIASVTDNKGCVVVAPHANITGSATITTKVVPEIGLQPVDVTVCENETVTFVTDAGLTTNPSYQWYVDTGSGMNPIASETSATLTFTAASAMNGNKYSVVISGDCTPAATSDTVTLTVNELPEIISPPVSVSLCTGENAVLGVDAGVTTNPVYLWYVDTGSGWTPASGVRYQGTTTDTLTIVSVLESMSGYQYKVRVSGTCAPYVESAPVTLTVTRQAEIVQHPATQVVCEGEAVSFVVDAGLTTSPSYQWQISADGGVTWNPIAGATAYTYTIPSASSSDDGSAYRVVVSSSCGTSVTSITAYLSVNELPEIISQPSDVSICEYAIADFIVNAGVTAGATYKWQRSTDGGVTWNDITESSTYFGVSTMNLKVNGALRSMNNDMFRVIVGGICSPSVTSDEVTLTVYTAPEIITQPVSVSICENTATFFEVDAQGTALTYQWYVDTGSGAGFEVVTNTGVYSDATTNTLTLTNVPSSYNNYRYRVEISGTCLPVVYSYTVQLGVSVETVINEQPADSVICEYMTASFTVDADGANLTYQWQVYDGSTWSDLSNTGLYVGVQTATLMVLGPPRTMDGTHYRVIIGSDCSADLISGEAVLSINTAPELSDHPDEFRGCPGGTATFSVTASGSGLIYQWQVNSGSGFVNVYDDLTYSGTDADILTISNLDLSMNGYLVRAVVSGTCMPPVTSYFAALRVYSEPAIVAEPADAEVCDEASVIYYAQVSTTGAGETTVWQVNDGSSWTYLADNSQYQGSQTTYLAIMYTDAAMNGYHYRLEVTGPCGVYYSREALLTVNIPPTAEIAPTDTLLVCGSVPTQIHGNPSGGSGVYVQHRWYGDIAPLNQYNVEDPVFNTSLTGFYTIIYQVTDDKGCTGRDTVVIKVEQPVAMFTPDYPSGCEPLTVNFTNGSSGYTSLLWDFGDGSTSTDVNPSHTYPNSTSSLEYYIVKLEVTSENGCTSSMENWITVYPEITSDFTLSSDTICSGEAVLLTSLPGAYRYYWIYGDTQEEYGSNVIYHIYTNYTSAPVTYDITLRTESFFGCLSETTMQLLVYPTPAPAFSADPVSQTYPNATVTFTNTTPTGTWDWLWRFGDGNTSTGNSPVYTYADPGTYSVTLIADNGVCMDSVTHNINILPTPPVADFDSIPPGCMPLSVIFNNTSLYATTYYWDFGDGHASTAANPVYTYLQAGTYQVTLTATGPGGTDTRSRLVYVYQSPSAYFQVTPTTVYVNDERVRLFNLSVGAEYYIWEFGDGDTSHLAEPYHLYTSEGVYDITLHAYSANGCYDTYILSPGVTVEPFGDLIFATVFKPNLDGPVDVDGLPTSGDAVDQYFYPPIRETVINYHLQIFNRWGVLIFESYDINKPWNGYYRNKLCPQGVYVWLVEGKYANGRPFKKTGDITLLH